MLFRSLAWVDVSTGKDDVILATALGKLARFAETEVRPMGRDAAGVIGIRLARQGDRVVSMSVVEPDADTEPLEHLLAQRRVADRRALLERAVDRVIHVVLLRAGEEAPALGQDVPERALAASAAWTSIPAVSTTRADVPIRTYRYRCGTRLSLVGMIAIVLLKVVR